MPRRPHAAATTLAALVPLLALAGTPPAIGAAQEVVAYRAARSGAGDGPPIEDATLVVRDGKVAAVGPADSVAVPEGAEVRGLGPAVLIPGLVVAETGLAEGGRDDELALTPGVRALDGFDFFEDFSRALAGGVTTVQLSPGRARLLPGAGRSSSSPATTPSPDPVGRGRRAGRPRRPGA